jgi:hypothetical protein
MNTTRTWKCPQCGFPVEISYDWLAEHGGPVCEKCDCDMELQHEAGAIADERAAAVERLLNKADAAGLAAEDFDEIVHELAASVASDVNNGGLEDQIAYLVQGLGADHAEKQLDKLIEERQEDSEDTSQPA